MCRIVPGISLYPILKWLLSIHKFSSRLLEVDYLPLRLCLATPVIIPPTSLPDLKMFSMLKFLLWNWSIQETR